MIQFDLPKNQSSIIKVIGVGGGGSNAVNHMYSENIEGVDFIICNTDAQAIALSTVPNKIQLGPELTQGLGAGANPNIGREATQESLEEIKNILAVNTKMVFVTAGMGGGTGTGGAPLIAKICKELGILTVGIVTTPFGYEGKHRLAQAKEGINLLKENVDTLLVISNDKLRQQYGNLKMKEAFVKADNVLATAAKCITGVINSTGQINVDFADVCTVMRDGGVAILGSGTASGEERAYNAIESALNSPLLNDNDIFGAKWILINITCSEGEHEFTMDEVDVIQDYIRERSGENTEVIVGMGYNEDLSDSISITLIATGFPHKDPFQGPPEKVAEVAKVEKIVLPLTMPASKIPVQPAFVFEEANKAPQEPQATPAPAPEAVPPVQDAAVRLMPTLQETPENVEVRSSTTVDKTKEEKEVFQISSTKDQTPVVQFDLTPDAVYKEQKINLPTPNAEESLQKDIDDASNRKPLSSGGFLAKPQQIYAEAVEQKSNSTEEPLSMHIKETADEPEPVMQMIVKDSNDAADEKPIDNTVKPIMMVPVEDPAMQDETEDLRRRAQDRISKLRNLSFNINAADPNTEFDTVPAYLRRNMEMHNQIADVESFYSNYTVKTDDKNQSEISTINTYLDGKKPD